MTILLIILARIVEALRDAIDFNKGAQDMGVLWHGLKFVQYPLIFAAGRYWQGNKTRLVIAVLIAWPVFELSLRLFRLVRWPDWA